MRKHLVRAWTDTLRQAGHAPGLILLVGVPVLALVAHLLLFGEQEMIAELSPAVSFFAALGVVALLLFAGNLIASPYKFQKERGDAADEKIRENAEKLSSLSKVVQDALEEKPDLRVEVLQIMWSPDETEVPELGMVAALMTIANVGRMPSGADRWGVAIIDEDGTAHGGRLRYYNTMGLAGTTYRSEDYIFTKTASALSRGEKAQGIFFGFVPRDILLKDGPKTVRVHFHDVLGAKYETFLDFGGEDKEGEFSPGLLPGMRPVYEGTSR